MKKVIYCAITGSYDSILQPRVVDPSWDYVMFISSDVVCGTEASVSEACGSEKVGVWEIRHVDQDHGGSIATSRYYKLNPQAVLPEYDWWLWIDGNIEILDDTLYRCAEKAIESGEACGDNAKKAYGGVYFGLPHPFRDDIADEILQIHRMRIISYSKSLRMIDFLYKEEGFPRHYGLLENNIILRRNCPIIVSFNTLWWEMFKKFPPRDQFTNSYCMWKCGIKPALLLGPGVNARNCPGLHIHSHYNPKRHHTSLWRNIKRAFTRRMLAMYINLRLGK